MMPLPADRITDARVAREIMGLNVVSEDWPCGYAPDCGNYEAAPSRQPRQREREYGPVYVPKDGGVWPPRKDSYGDPDSEFVSVEPVPFYSTEIEAAWTVVERLTAHPHVLISLSRTLEPRGWICRVGSSGTDFCTHAPTAPLAICRTALASRWHLSFAFTANDPAAPSLPTGATGEPEAS